MQMQVLGLCLRMQQLHGCYAKLIDVLNVPNLKTVHFVAHDEFSYVDTLFFADIRFGNCLWSISQSFVVPSKRRP